ncbi:MAG: helix-turn-helix domain-containing protein [Burkholderiales bacterium]|nr:helix-turn-helix domain-containing protein [Burkholderiales bacterium]
MQQTELVLTDEDRVRIGDICSKGVRQVRELNRAHVLAALDRKVSEASIMQVLGVGRKMIWRTRVAYLDGGLELALTDLPRPGKPRSYQTGEQVEVAALACSAPPEGAKRWTLLRLEAAARKRPQMRGISRETIRRLLKKTASNPGAA